MDALIAAAIHDAKNGLSALNTWLAEAQREHPSHALTEAQSVATRVSAQMVELLALYRAAEGSLRLAIDDHDLTDFCQDLGAGRVVPPQSALRLETKLAAAADIGAWAFDAYQVNLVLLDALRNAVRFARRVVRLSVEKTVDGICFTVADDGPGFPAEILDGAETTMDSGSSGLGLRFARLIAQRHATPDGRHGRIELGNDSDANGGAVFRLFLP
jgi:signal transduction histidine kinase